MQTANLFIIGSMKSGTTSLHEYLNDHPGIYMSEEKEPGYFVEELGWERGPAGYRQLFADSGEATFIGESSTHYAKYPTYKGVPEKIHQYNPQARLIYLMRNPFARLVSHYWHEVRAAFSGGELLDIKSAVRKKEAYLSYSDYALQLEQYLRHFDRAQIYLLTFEELTADPESEVRKIFEWLGVETGIDLPSINMTFNKKPEAIEKVAGFGLLNKLQYSGLWDRVSGLVPQGLKDYASSKAYKKVEQGEQQAEIESLKEELLPQLRENVARLKKLADREFPQWPDYN